MATEIWVAIVAVIGGAVTGLGGAFWSPLLKDRFERRQRAAQLRDTYSPPLLQAAFDLQSRLYNIVREQFFDAYYRSSDESRREYAEYSTLWLIGQYLGWVEILRREAQFLDFGSRKKNQRLQRGLLTVAEVFASDTIADPPAIYRTTQRAIGESMIGHTAGNGSSRPRCLGYSEFVRQLEEGELRWFDGLRRDLDTLADARRHARLIVVQRALVDLIDTLDPSRSRFPDLNKRGKLPRQARSGLRRDLCHTVARFTVRPSDYDQTAQDFPDAILRRWSERHRVEKVPSHQIDESAGGEAEFRRRLGPLGTELHVHTDYRDTALEIRAGVCPPRWASRRRLMPDAAPVSSGTWLLPVARRRSRVIVNDLLERFDRPSVL